MTQNDRLLLWLWAGRSITPLGALKKWGIFRLAARINDLRKLGIEIITTIRKRGSKRYASYRMA